MIDMTKPKRILYTIWLMLMAVVTATPTASAATASAESSINKMIAAMKQKPSWDVVFTVWNNGNSTSGSMNVSGKCFHLSTPQMKVWYDGKTQWSYSPSAKEVDITEPTGEELLESNPLSILSSLNKNYTFRRLKASSGEEKIELTPKTKTSSFASATVTLNASTSLPKAVTIKDAKGRLTTITISSFKGGATKPASAFRFNTKSYPGVEVVDLR